jgi:hypothetical protein
LRSHYHPRTEGVREEGVLKTGREWKPWRRDVGAEVMEACDHCLRGDTEQREVGRNALTSFSFCSAFLWHASHWPNLIGSHHK